MNKTTYFLAIQDPDQGNEVYCSTDWVKIMLAIMAFMDADAPMALAYEEKK